MARGTSSDSHRYAEFLPDAEGLVERRHSPAAGLLILAVAAVFAGLIAWAGLTEVEQVVRAQGQVEPADRVKVINHPDGGRLAQIHVAEGDAVVAGQPLVTFDGELGRAELAELTGRWQLKAAEVARLLAEASGEDPVFDSELLQQRPGLVQQQHGIAGNPSCGPCQPRRDPDADRRAAQQRDRIPERRAEPLSQQPGSGRQGSEGGAHPGGEGALSAPAPGRHGARAE